MYICARLSELRLRGLGTSVAVVDSCRGISKGSPEPLLAGLSFGGVLDASSWTD